jgi:hypothetical protein
MRSFKAFFVVTLGSKNTIDIKHIAKFEEAWYDAGLKKIKFNKFGRAYPNVP